MEKFESKNIIMLLIILSLTFIIVMCNEFFSVDHVSNSSDNKVLHESNWIMYLKMDSLVKITFKESYYICGDTVCSEYDNKVINFDYVDENAKKYFENIDLSNKNLKEAMTLLVDSAKNNGVDTSEISIITNLDNYAEKELVKNIVSNNDSVLNVNVDYQENIDEKSLIGSVNVNSYTVKFDCDGGTPVENQIVIENGLAYTPITPTKSGYKFIGWYYNDSEYNFNTSVTADLNLVAKWEEEKAPDNSLTTTQENPTVTKPENPPKTTYTVNFNTNGGSSVPSQSIEPGKTASKPITPTKSGYTFLGWYTSNKKEYNFSSQVNSNITLSALWAPKLNYTKLKNGKWIFINNPESISSPDMLADSDLGNTLIYKSSFSGNTEIYFEHTVSGSLYNNIYYAIRIYNPNSSSVTLKINKCGASQKYVWETTWQQYYTGTCSIRGNTYTIPSKKWIMIYLNGNNFVTKTDQNTSGISKAPNAFDGVLNVNSSDTLYISTLAFKDVSKTFNAIYNGNNIKNYDQVCTARVYSGDYNGLPIINNNMTFDIYNETPKGNLPVSYTNLFGNSFISKGDGVYEWFSNTGGASINTSILKVDIQPYQNVSDYINLSVPTSTSTITLGPYPNYKESRNIIHPKFKVNINGWPYNWGNWAVHYNENITIVNHTSQTQTVSFELLDVANSIVVSYYNGKFNYYKKDSTIWKVNIPANSSKNLNSIITLGGNSNGKLIKRVVLN